MQREILFRGIRVDNLQWIEGSLVTDREDCYINPFDSGVNIKYSPKQDESFNSSIELFHAKKVIPETVGQFIGRCDKNGVKIFEGDELSITIENGEIKEGSVFYKKKVCQFMLSEKDIGKHNVWQITEKRLPIITGNIHNKTK